MRVLLAHNFYGASAPSGEDVAYANERDLLLSSGLDVCTYERRNDDINLDNIADRLQVGAGTVWSVRTYREMSTVCREFRPDVAHLHNIFPLISPSAYYACIENGIPVVQTLHNYRLICPGALLLRDGKVCDDCVGKSLRPALYHRCYRGSLPATAAIVAMLALHRRTGTFKRCVSRYIAVSHFAAKLMVQGGIPADRITVKPNFVAAPSIMFDDNRRTSTAVFAGRLSKEKGILTLLEAWERIPDVRLFLFGDGPLRTEVEEIIKLKNLNAECEGLVPRSEIFKAHSSARFSVTPSECYETFGLAAAEALACGAPVIASRIGALQEIVSEGRNGLLFTPGDVDDLVSKIRSLLQADATSWHQGALNSYRSRYNADEHLHRLLDLYKESVE